MEIRKMCHCVLIELSFRQYRDISFIYGANNTFITNSIDKQLQYWLICDSEVWNNL